MRLKPEINPKSKRLLEDSKHSTYVNLKVEDRLRLYGIQLKETKDSKAALDQMNSQYESMKRSTTPDISANQAAMSDTRSLISASTSNLASVANQKDFQRRQEEHLKKSEELRQKLHEKHQFKPQPFKSARQASVTPPRAKAQGDDTGDKEETLNGGAVSDF